MPKTRLILLAVVLAFAMLFVAALPSSAFVCNDYPGGCCDYKVLGKPLPIYC